jgi:hypothetical protein
MGKMLLWLGFGHARSKHVCNYAPIKNEGGGLHTNKGNTISEWHIGHNLVPQLTPKVVI